MTPEAKRIAIAEACGWTIETQKEPQSWVFGGWPPNTPSYGKTINTTYYRQLPDYLNDLNAMHEAEKVLAREQATEYSHIVYRSANREYNYPAAYLAMCATAAQRADAFLEAIGVLA